MNGDWVGPAAKRVNLFISTTLGSEFFTQWNFNTSLSDSHILFCRKVFCISPHNRMGLKRDLIRISHSEFLQWGTGFQTFIQRYRTFIWLGWDIIDNSYFSCFCRFSNHSVMLQIKLFPLRSFSFANFSMIPSFICSWIILSYPQAFLIELSFLVKFCNLSRLFTSLLRNWRWFYFQIGLVS